MRALSLATMLAILPAAAAAQDASTSQGGSTLLDPAPPSQLRDLAADQPNETNTPTTVDAGHLQAELTVVDFTRDRDRGSASRVWTWGETNFRLGLLDQLEVNVDVEPYLVDHERDGVARSRSTGFGDLTVGAKYNFWGEDIGDTPWSTALAIQPQVKLPTANHDLGNGHAEWSVALPFQMTLPAGFNFSLQPRLSGVRNSDNSGYTTDYQGAIAIDHNVVGQIDLQVEYAITGTSEHNQGNQQTFDVGLTAPLGKNLAVDTGVELGLNRAAPDAEWVAGITKRF